MAETVTELAKKSRESISALADKLEKGENYDKELEDIASLYEKAKEKLENRETLELKEQAAVHDLKASLGTASQISTKQGIDSGIAEPELLRLSVEPIDRVVNKLETPVLFEKVELDQILKNEKGNLERIHPRVEVELDTNSVKHVEVDEYLIKMMFRNLLQNGANELKNKAKKAIEQEAEMEKERKELAEKKGEEYEPVPVHKRPKFGKITLRLKDMGSYIKAIYEDNGPGFYEGFDPHASKTTHKEEGGTGVGIPTIMSIAEQHKISTNWKNRPEGGACVTLRIPKEHKKPI